MAKSTVCLVILTVLLLTTACRQKENNNGENERRKHWIEITQKGVGMLYLDQVPPESILKQENSPDEKQSFYTYQIGFMDSSINSDKRTEVEEGQYFQYRIQQDWTAITRDMDSIKPVFFHPRARVHQQINEGVLVFEVNKDEIIDTLIYNDSYGSWGIQKFILHEQ